MSTDTGDRHVAIIGMSGRFPGAPDVDTLWRLIVEGRDAISRFDPAEDPDPPGGGRYVRARGVLDDVERFDADFFGFAPAEATALDPQHRVWLEVAWEALESAGYAHDRHDQIVSVYAGSFPNTYLFFNLLPDRAALEEYVRMRRPQSFGLMVQNDPAFLPTRTAYKLGLRGPAVNVQTACSTSLVAVAMAVQSLTSFESDISIAGGVCITVPQRNGYFYQEGAIHSRDGTCRPYDASASGTVFGNGAGAVVLKRLADARRDGDPILAVIRGAALNNDGSAKVSYFAPSVQGQAEVITTALALAEVDPETIGYVEGHGTATPMGDPIELQALKLAYGDRPARQSCCLGSVKGNVGHLDAAAGVTGLIRAVFALRNRQLPGTAHFESPNPELRLEDSPFYVSARTAPWPDGAHPRRAAVSSFGIGGTNAHVVLEEAPADAAPAPRDERTQEPTTLVLSARSRAALDAYTARLADWMDGACSGGRAPRPLTDVAGALRDRRRIFPHRRAVRVASWADARAALRDGERWDTAVAVDGTPKLVFAFPGQGSLQPGAMSRLLSAELELRRPFERLARAASDLVHFDLVEWARDPRAPSEPVRRDNAKTQLAIFCADVALARWLESRGVHADGFVGHSLGEWVGAHLAGVLEEEDALRAVHRRGALMQETGPGAALVVRLPEADVGPYLGDGVTLACVNGPQLCLLSGRPDAIERCTARLAAAGVQARAAPIDVAVHSPHMDGVVDALRTTLVPLAWREPARPLLSTVTGRWMTSAEATSVEYWAAQPRRPVLFDAAVTTLLEESCSVVVEAGMGDALTTLVRGRARGSKRHAALPLLGRVADSGQWEADRLQRALNELWGTGVAIDVVGDVRPSAAVPELPTYPFQRQRHWKDPPASAAPAASPMQADLPQAATALAGMTAGEQRVAQIWMKLLGVVSVVPDDDFFMLGGDSLLAVRLAEELRKAFSAEIALGRIFELRTVRALAQALGGARTDGTEPVVKPSAPAGGAAGSVIALTKPGPGAHLFCICGIQLYQQLADRLAPRHTASGVFLPVEEEILAGREMPRLEEMAAMYRGVVRAAQPRGPYRLAGVSFGGMLAFELGRQLQAEGEVVDFVGIFDTPLPHTIRRRDWLGAHLRLAAREGPAYVVAHVRERLRRLAAGTLGAGSDARRTAEPTGGANAALVRGRLYEHAARRYCRAMPSFRGELHYFRAEQRNPFESAAAPLHYHWPRFVEGRCEVHEVPGGHLTMLSEPGVDVLADLVGRALDRCVASVAAADQQPRRGTG